MNQGIVEWEDLDIFFEEFGIPATLELADGTTYELRGHFDTPYMKRDFGELIVDADDPSFTCKWQSGFENTRKGDKLTISGEDFYIESAAQSDGTGVASFILTRATTQDAEGDTPPQNQGGPPSGGLFGSGR